MPLYTEQNNCTQLPNYRKLNLASAKGQSNIFPHRIGKKLKSILYRTERQNCTNVHSFLSSFFSYSIQWKVSLNPL